MKKLVTLSVLLLLFSLANAAPPEERIVLQVGQGEEARRQAAEMTEILVESGLPFEVSSTQAEGQAYLLRQLGESVVWKRALHAPREAWQEFQAAPYDVPDGALLGWTEAVPAKSERPLRRDEVIELYATGRAGLEVKGMIGGQTVRLFEERPGYYAGAYRVAPDDRVDAEVAISATDQAGNEEVHPLAVLAIQGLAVPQLTGLGQAGIREWVLQGEAAPGTQVEIAIEITLGGLFGKNILRRKVEAFTDSDGKFEAVASLGTLTSSPKGTVRVKSVDADGVEVVGPEQEVQFRSRVRVIYRPSYYDPWGYPGYWRRPYRRICR